MLGNKIRRSRSGSGVLIALGGFTAAVVTLIPHNSTAAHLWVDRNSLGGTCDDSRSRTTVTKTTPWCTLEAAGATVQPGDVVHVREGEYTEINNCSGCSHNAVLEISVTGTAEAPIRFMAETWEEVVLSGTGGAIRGVQFFEHNGNVPRFVEVSGLIVRDFDEEGVFIRDVSDITIRNLEVTNCRKGAIEIHDSQRITIEGCQVHDNHMTGWTSVIDLFRCKDGNVIRGNYIWSNTDEDYRETEGHGIIMDTCGTSGGALIENNVLWDNEGWCIAIYHSDNANIRNNTCWQNSRGRDNGTGELRSGGSQTTIQNNILVSRGGGPALMITDDGDPLTVASDFNILWSPNTETVVIWPLWQVGTLADFQRLNTYGWGAHSMQLDPQLIDPTNRVFQLNRLSSAIDSGSDPEAAAIDINGFPRPLDSDGDGISRTDRGAYERAGIFRDDFESSNLTWSSTYP